VAAAYEPGSNFKMITLSGALESGLTNPREFIDCQMGSILVAGRLIHDHKPFGILNVRDVLAQSSDVGTIKIALRLGAPKLYEKIREFGMGQLTGIELPGENRGLFRPLENWTASSIGSIAIGQEVSVTPVQIISAISAIANGGTLYRPRVVEDIHGGSSAAPRSAEQPQEVTDAKTAATLRDMMESVILEGTGKPAKLNGYTAAGKSGTAQKIDPATGRYSPNQYVASFVGFSPVNTPVVTILVVLDSPVGLHYGGDVGGPVFKRISEQVLAYLEVSHDIPAGQDLQTASNQRGTRQTGTSSDGNRARIEAAAAKEVSGSASAPTVAFGDEEAVGVPDFSGQGLRSVTEACTSLGLVPAPIGNGVAVEQVPDPGVRVPRGSRVTVRFGRAGEILPATLRGQRN
jgi:cell division protein FtsI (penicillin-binding protein 3)